MMSGNRRRGLKTGAALAAAIAFAQAVPAHAQEQTYGFDIPAQDMGPALRAFARAARQQVAFDDKTVRGKRSVAIRGAMTARQALDRLIGGTGLTVARGSSGLFIIRSAGQAASGEADAGRTTATEEGADRPSGATPEILVVGQRSINADIRRTEDDAQPYVVFDSKDVARSQATSIGDFLKTRLPMNATQTTATQSDNFTGGNRSEINLRGLGANQTLILVDGRRMPSFNAANLGFGQADINGIPMAMIERIEVLPATASGSYGGGATGGVVNIITRKDYSGLDLGATFGGTEHGGAGNYRFDASAGFALEGGRTRVVISGSYAHSDPLYTGDRDFSARARQRQFQNNPASFQNLTSPPAGYTTNICTAASATATSCSTAPLILDTGVSLGSNRTFIPMGYAGASSDLGAALRDNAGRYNLDIPAGPTGRDSSLISGTTVTSLNANLRRSFGSDVEVYSDFSWLQNKSHAVSLGAPVTSVTIAANAPNNPFSVPIRVTFPLIGLSLPIDTESSTLRATGGFIWRLGKDWAFSADYTWARSRSEARRSNFGVGDPDGSGPGIGSDTAYANGTLDVLRDLNQFPLDYAPYRLPSPNVRIGPIDTVLNNAFVKVSGPAIALPGGPLTVLGQLEYRKEVAETSFQDSITNANVGRSVYIPSRSQTVWSAYAETRAPILSNMPFAEKLEIQASVRHDSYQTMQPVLDTTPPSVQVTLPSRTSPLPNRSDSVNKVQATKFTVGLLYQPIRDVTLRASYATGFLPPSITQLISDTTMPTGNLADPKRGGISAATPRTQIAGGNPDLVPEESRSLSAGIIFTPSFIPGLRLSADYIRIRKTNEIRTPTPQEILNLEDFYPDRITRDPLEANAPAGYTAGPIRIIDARLINAARSEIEAIDFHADYSFQTKNLGKFSFFAITSWQPHLKRRNLINTPFIDSVGYSDAVLEWRGNGGISWEIGKLFVNWNAEYYDSYYIYGALAEPLTAAQQATRAAAVLSQGSNRVPSQMYHDLMVTYRFGSDAGTDPGLRNLELSLGVANLFDKRPPVLATTSPTGGYSTYGDPRLRRFSLILRKHF